MAFWGRFARPGRLTQLGWPLAAALAVGVLLVIGAVAAFAVSIPLPNSAPGGQATKVFSSDGKLIGMLHAEQNRTIVDLGAISPNLQHAVVATEDRDFYKHGGISPKGTLRALFTDVRSGRIEQGGSTLTQQYARNAFATVGTQRSIFRKLKEIALAIKIERKYSKQKILEFYLNTVYFGRGAYGAEAAARTYFKKPAKDLDLGESAYLAGVLRSPHAFQPDKHPEAAVSIRNEVLSDMVKAGYISPSEEGQAKSKDILREFNLAPTLRLDNAKAGYFLEYVRRTLLSKDYGFTEADIVGGGLQVTTTLDLRMQAAAENAISSTLNRPDDPEAALIAMDPQGAVKAMVGGRDVTDPARAKGFNYAANVGKNKGGRQAGSAFKPFALAAMVSDGKSVRSRFPGPREITINSPRCRNKDGTPWQVSNFGDESFGTLDVVEATAKSVNTVYAQIMDQVVSPQDFVSIAGKAGIDIPERDVGCALTLGTTPVTPLDLARAFTTFAARGQRPDPLIITSVVAANGKTVRRNDPRTEQTMDENVADTVNYVLQEVIKGGTGTAAKISRPAAGKTGTTQNHVDAWFAGYTPALTAVVWTGYPPDDSGKIPPMLNVHGQRVTGGSFPATMWRKFMQEALKGLKSGDFVKPDLTGDVLNPAPSPCPTGTIVSTESPGTAGSNCLPPAPPPPSPLPVDTPPPVQLVQPPPPDSGALPAIDRPVVPGGNNPRPTPSPSVTPSPSPSPTPSQAAGQLAGQGPPGKGKSQG